MAARFSTVPPRGDDHPFRIQRDSLLLSAAAFGSVEDSGLGDDAIPGQPHSLLVRQDGEELSDLPGHHVQVPADGGIGAEPSGWDVANDAQHVRLDPDERR